MSEGANRGAWIAELKATLQLAYPLVLTNLTQNGMQTVDVVMLGQAGPGALAAGALGANLFTIFLVFGMGIATAVSPMLAKERGARAHSVRDIRRTVRQGLWAAVVIALPVWVVLWNAEGILLMLGQDPALSASAAEYLRALKWSLLPVLWFLVLRGFVSVLEQPIWALLVSVGGILCNAGLNYLLIFGNGGFPELGVLGAGVATTISNLLMFAAMVLIVSRQRRLRRYHLFGRFWRADWVRFRQLFRLGLPIAGIFTLEVGVFAAAVFLMGLINADSVAAHAVAIQIAAITFMVPMGLSQAVTVRVGLMLGRGDPAGITRAGWTSFALGTGFMAMMAPVMVTIPYQLVHLFLDESDAANTRVIALAVSFLSVAAVFQIVDGAQAVAAGMLRGLQDTTVPMIYAVLGYWIIAFATGVGLAFYAGWGGFGIWVGLATGLAVVAVLMLGRWMRRERLKLTG